MPSSENINSDSNPNTGSIKQGTQTTQFSVPPKPILNKNHSDQHMELPKLQTSSIQQPRPVGVPSPTSLITPINQAPSSTHGTPSTGGLKHTNSISFNVPSGVEKSHRGSISARPSQVNMVNGYPKITSPLATVSSRQPSHQNARLPSLVSVAPEAPSPLTTQRKKSPSPYSSRQGSSNGDYLQFYIKQNNNSINNSNNGVEHGPLESRTNSISSTVSFQSPASLAGSDFSDSHTAPVPANISSALSTFTDAVAIPPQKKNKALLKAVVASPTGPVVPFTQYLQREDDKKIHILIGATGSVATIKVPLIIDKLQKIYGPEKVSIQLVVSKPAEHFLRGSKISTEVKIWRDSDEWSNTFGKPGDPILHVELRKWADIFLIAPLSANTLAKVANGLCDNLLTSIVRSWNPTIPILVAPAMNTLMYTHPMTKKHLNILSEDFKFITVLKPVEKVLVCGDIGMGGMREWTDIVDTVMRKIKEIRLAKIVQKKLDDDIAEEEEEEDDDDENDDDDDDDDDDDFNNSDDSEEDSDEDSDDSSSGNEVDEFDDLDMELEGPEAVKGSVDNLTHHLSNVVSLTGDPVKDHNFTSTTDLL